MGTDRTTQTLETAGLGRPETSHACLFLAIECDRPLAGPARIALRGAQSVQLRRGGERRIVDAEVGAEVRLTVPDRTMSSKHAELCRVGGGWELRDLSSKNGTIVNAQRCSSRMLTDGDLIETGRTLFLFRRALPGSSGSLDAAALQERLHGMATLVPRLEAELDRVRTIAKGSISVTILGESGTGKELLASAIHALSGRTGPFVAVNCGAVPSNLIASELFGFRKGAFSGANEDRSGLIRSADHGTLLLDEIGELPPESQVALLRVLQEREVLPLGATRPVNIDVRFLCATSRDLAELVATDRFRADLHSRLAGFTCRLPPLAQRREDLGLILANRLREYANANVTISVEAARAIWSYSWPGNIRELDQCVHAAVLLANGTRIAVSHLPEALLNRREEGSRRRERRLLSDEDIQRRQQIIDSLRSHAGNISAVARELGKERKQVHRWLERYEIDPKSFRR